MYDKVKHVRLNEKQWLSSACQCTFPYVFEVRTSEKYPNSTPETSITILIDKTDPFAKELHKRIHEMMTAEYGGNKDRWPEGWNNPLKKGDRKADKYPEYEGKLTLKAGLKKKCPTVVDASKNEILDAAEIYSGCYVRIKFDLYQMSKKKGYHGVGVGLRLVQKIADAEPFVEGAAPEKAEELPDLDPSVAGASNTSSGDSWGDFE